MISHSIRVDPEGRFEVGLPVAEHALRSRDDLRSAALLHSHVAIHAGQMADSARLIGLAFEKNVATDATDAKPGIWEDWAKFESAIADFREAAQKLATTAEGGDPAAVGAAVKALGKSCGGCHKPFRKPKEESYKNQ